MTPIKIAFSSLLLLSFFSCNSEKSNLKTKQEQMVSENTETKEAETKNNSEISYNLNLKDFIPKNYALLDSASGNLNLDNYKDYVLVLKKIDEEETSDVIDHPEKRPLLILVGQEDGSFKQIKRNDNSVYCVDCGGIMGDPFVGLSIEKGSFTINHYAGSAWRWTKDITFKYSETDQDWILFKLESTSFNANEIETKPEQKILTKKDFGKVKFEKYDIYKED